jgi:SAM-dependent methyltransferase
MNVLIKFRHGLGDAVQLTIVLAHLGHYRPDWNVDAAAKIGTHSALFGLSRNVFALDRDDLQGRRYDRVLDLGWHECHAAYAGCPSTKPSLCLLNEFALEPLLNLCRYTVRRRPLAERLAGEYLGEVCKAGPDEKGRFPAVLIHYQGNTSRQRKDLPDDLVESVCRTASALGFVPVILDWDRRSPLVDGKRIHNPAAEHPMWGGTRTGDAEVLAALIEASSLMIGIDSGPLHVAGACTTPTLGVWTGNHPVHYFDLADNVLHLVPVNHAKRADGEAAVRFFARVYRHRTYRNLDHELPALVARQLAGQDVEFSGPGVLPRRLGADGYGRRYYEEHRAAGLDYLAFGEWQKQYGRWFVQSLGLKGKRLLDVGCACGAVLRGLGEAGAVVQGVDVNEHAIALGRAKWPDMARLLSVCDAVNLHPFADGNCDAIHAAQVAEHWKAELVPHILAELHRISVPGGLLFCALDTEELVARQGRRSELEDPTHACIRPLAWWHERLREAGWKLCSGEFEGPLRSHPESFLKRYDWDWFVARKA